MDKSDAIKQACSFISQGKIDEAGRVIDKEYPFVPLIKNKRSYTPREMTMVFVRDGFVDRYRGTKLIYPPALRLLSNYLPEKFPYHKNGKMSEGHIGYWELFPTIDHLIPVARGGKDNHSNWVCCSMLTNSIKSNWTLEQLQWEVLPEGNLQEWDGMIHWFIQQVHRDKKQQEHSYIKTWFNAALDCAETNPLTNKQMVQILADVQTGNTPNDNENPRATKFRADMERDVAIAKKEYEESEAQKKGLPMRIEIPMELDDIDL